MNLTIHYVEESEPAFLKVCVDRVIDFYGRRNDVTVTPQIYCRKRMSDGWLEYVLVLPYQDGGQISVAAIQRNLGHEVEFHS